MDNKVYPEELEAMNTFTQRMLTLMFNPVTMIPIRIRKNKKSGVIDMSIGTGFYEDWLIYNPNTREWEDWENRDVHNA